MIFVSEKYGENWTLQCSELVFPESYRMRQSGRKWTEAIVPGEPHDPRRRSAIMKHKDILEKANKSKSAERLGQDADAGGGGGGAYFKRSVSKESPVDPDPEIELEDKLLYEVQLGLGRCGWEVLISHNESDPSLPLNSVVRLYRPDSEGFVCGSASLQCPTTAPSKWGLSPPGSPVKKRAVAGENAGQVVVAGTDLERKLEPYIVRVTKNSLAKWWFFFFKSLPML